MHAGSASARERIIELFAKRQPAYHRADVTRLLGITDEALEHAIRTGVIDHERDDRDTRIIPWEDVAHLALEEWTPRMIHAALHNTAHEAIPHLNQHRLIQVSLPIYLIRYLDYQARQESRNRLPRNASDIIERIIHEHVDGDDRTRLETALPGITLALTYPYYTPRRESLAHRCRYCDTSITATGREVCKNCEARHEPKEHRGEYGITALEEPVDE